MCGIWAVIPRTSQGLFRTDMPVIKQMMLDTAQRGEHSTGFFITNYQYPKEKPTGAKVLGGPHNLIYNKDLWNEVETWTGAKGGCFVGHGRQATRGQVTARNAHPFQHEHITLVHNGTLYSGVNFSKKGEVEIDVDSHALAVAMAERGVAEALTDISGAYAVIVHDAKEGCLYIARNNDRPLYSYSTQTRHFLMSEIWFLEAILERHNLMEKDVVTRIVTPETLIQINLDNPQKYKVVANLKELKEKKEEIKHAAWKVQRDAESAANVVKFGHTKKKSRIQEFVPKTPVEITFLVKSVRPWKSNYWYECVSAAQEPIHFICDQNRLEYIDRVGRAQINRFHVKDNVKTLFVKHREIKWAEIQDDIVDVEPIKEEGPANIGGTFRFYNGKSLSAAVWAQRLEDEGCFQCCRTFTMLDYKTTVLMDDDNFLCKPCNDVMQAFGDKTQDTTTTRH